MLSLIVFILLLSVLVLSHEAGHFFSARFFGIRVDEFGFGLPPRIFGVKRGGTLYSLNSLPFGGFVKIFGEEGESRSDATSFSSKPAYQRAVVLFAGVLANLFLAYLVFSLVSFLGVPEALSEDEAILATDSFVAITEIAPASPAESAGIALGDKILNFKTISEFQNFVSQNRGKEIEIRLGRGGEILNKRVLARASPPQGEGSLGIALMALRIKTSFWYQAPWDGAKLAWNAFLGTLYGFYGAARDLFFGRASQIEVAGPVGIFSLTSTVLLLGLSTFLTFLALLSINLAILNILPIPGLDGGRLFFLLIETLRGRRISSKTSAWAHSIGLALLILLMILVTYRDIARVF